MLGTGVTFGVMAVTVAFLAAILGGFPLTGQAGDINSYSTDIEATDTLNTNDVQELGDSLLLSYTDLIDDIVSFQDNPSLERAEQRKNEMIGFAKILTGEFQSFSDSMKGEMDDLVAEANAEAEASQEASDTGDTAR